MEVFTTLEPMTLKIQQIKARNMTAARQGLQERGLSGEPLVGHLEELHLGTMGDEKVGRECGDIEIGFVPYRVLQLGDNVSQPTLYRCVVLFEQCEVTPEGGASFSVVRLLGKPAGYDSSPPATIESLEEVEAYITHLKQETEELQQLNPADPFLCSVVQSSITRALQHNVKHITGKIVVRYLLFHELQLLPSPHCALQNLAPAEESAECGAV